VKDPNAIALGHYFALPTGNRLCYHYEHFWSPGFSGFSFPDPMRAAGLLNLNKDSIPGGGLSMHLAGVSAVAVLTIVLAGCSTATLRVANPVAGPEPASHPGKPIAGRVHGGQQPLSGSHVYLFAADTTAYGASSASLLLNTADTHSDGTNYYVKTSAGGRFTIGASDYACAKGQQLYLYSTGGDAGFGASSAIGLLAALGTCGTGNTIANLPSLVFINEVTTVAASIAISGFATDATHIASSSTTPATTGLANAFLGAGNLGSISTGAAATGTAGGDGTPPQELIDTLADILAACVNSNGSTASGTPCNTVFSAANAAAGSTPTETATAAIYLAQAPSNWTSAFSLAVSNSPFQPILPSEPSAWYAAITYTASSLHAPNSLAIDGAGNIWISDSSTHGVLNELTPTGASAAGIPITDAAYKSGQGIAVTPSGDVWVVANGGVALFKPGTSTTKPVTSASFNNPIGIASDTSGNAWVANSGGNNVLEVTASGAVSTTSCVCDTPTGVAVDANDAYFTDNGNARITAVNVSSGLIDGGELDGLYSPVGVAVVHHVTELAMNLLVTDTTGKYLLAVGGPASELIAIEKGSLGGTVPYALAVDGADNAWVTDSSAPDLIEDGPVTVEDTTILAKLAGSLPVGSPAAGFNVGVDESGNVWVANSGGSVTEYVGAATPVTTPLATAAKNGTVGERP
jgi:hypothetical protein